MSGEIEQCRRTHIVHGLEPMTLGELADLSCGHCLHRLTMHVTRDGGRTFCAICHCLRHPGEDILQPHDFAPYHDPEAAS